MAARLYTLYKPMRRTLPAGRMVLLLLGLALALGGWLVLSPRGAKPGRPYTPSQLEALGRR